MRKISTLSIIGCLIPLIILTFHFKFYEQKCRIIESDAIHYYSYLPAVLVYQDISLKYLDNNLYDVDCYFFTNVKLPNGKHYFKTTMGVAMLEAVFVVPVHYYLKLTGSPTTGVSVPYKVALLISALFYFLIGLLLIRYMLLYRMKMEESVVALTILAIGLGTNIIVYVMREPGMSHIYSFFSIILLVYLIDKLTSHPTYRTGLLTGLVAGLVILIRPVNIIVFILFITWNIGTIKEFTQRITFFIKNPMITALIAVGILLIWIPQFTYYYYLSGNIIFSGYGGEAKFFFNNPQIMNNLFSFRKGWFLYTPVMLFAVIGIIPLYFKQRNYLWPVLLVLLSMIYINSSWYSWWFGGGYGQRAYIDIYGILAIPLAHFINVIWSGNNARKLTAIILVLILLTHNFYQFFQYHGGSLHYIGMTKEAYFYSIGRFKPGIRFDALLDLPDYDLASKGIYPKPKSKQKSEEEWIEYIAARFKENPEMMNFLTEKSASSRKNLETLIYDDSNYTLKNDRVFFEGVINSDWPTFYIKK